MPLYIPLAAAIAALLFVYYLFTYVERQDQGPKHIQQIAELIHTGSTAFMTREAKTVGPIILILAVLLYFAPLISAGNHPLNWHEPVALIFGSCFSALAGWIGMTAATKANSRTAIAAANGMPRALQVAFSGGAVMGFSVVGLALLGLTITYHAFGVLAIEAYAMGASFVALFARVGGGIFTKAADMGADLVGKLEANIPEDDPRNPAVIADNVGDNVGDVAGLGADLLESYAASIISSMILCASIYRRVSGNRTLSAEEERIFAALIQVPLYIAAVGIVGSIIGALYVHLVKSDKPQQALNRGEYIAVFLTMVSSGFIIHYMNFAPAAVLAATGITIYGSMGPFYAIVTGLLAGVLVGFISEYYTSTEFFPVKKLAETCESGPALAVTYGLAIGMESTFYPILTLSCAVMLSYSAAGIYGVSLAALGMLATTGMTVAVDAFGPIADNAGGIAEMGKMGEDIRKITDSLDAVGNTTAAVGKGFAIGSAAFASLGLFMAFIEIAELSLADVSIIVPVVIVGLLLGGMIPYLFSALLIKGVTNAAFGMIREVRRQFREIPGLLEGKVPPDSHRCVDIATQEALRSMTVPGLLAVCAPLVVGFIFGRQALAGLLVGTLVTGLPLAIQCGNSGGAMDNAKKYIESGMFGGKGTQTHAAAVVGDTVGDPLKDTVGPSVDILLKLMTIVSVVFVQAIPYKGIF